MQYTPTRPTISEPDWKQVQQNKFTYRQTTGFGPQSGVSLDQRVIGEGKQSAPEALLLGPELDGQSDTLALMCHNFNSGNELEQ